jgi:hypothetical protein
MKNLFSINKTNDKNADAFDPTPYLAARVSDEIRAKIKSAFSVVEDEYVTHEATEEEIALQKKGRRYWLLCMACFIAGFALLLGGGRLGLETISLYIAFPLAAGALFFNFKARSINRKQSSLRDHTPTIDFTEASKLLEEASVAAARELGIPKNALSVDVLPYHYVIGKREPHACGRKNRFDNVSMSLYIQKGDLCLATSQELYRIPLTDIRGYRSYDEDFEVDMWLKPEEHDSDKYAAYGLHKSGLMGRRGHGYIGLDIGGEYEILIPCYDTPAVKALLKLSEIQ